MCMLHSVAKSTDNGGNPCCVTADSSNSLGRFLDDVVVAISSYSVGRFLVGCIRQQIITLLVQH